MSCGIFGKLQVAVDHEGCEEKRQINDRGDEKALGRSVAVLAESEIKARNMMKRVNAIALKR